MTLPKYPKYKKTDVKWLTTVPYQWRLVRNKYFLKEVNNRSVTGKETLLTVSQYTGVTPRNNKIAPNQKNLTNAISLIDYKLVENNDIVMNIMLAWNGSLGVSRFQGIVSPAYCVYRSSENGHPFYLHYLYRTPLFTTIFKTLSTGVVESRLRLYPHVFFQLKTCLPPLSEQKQIASFLDAKSAQINRLTQKKKRLIKLLKEYRQAIINQAVTRGLDPNVPLKPSGVEWLGDIPDHWKISRLRNLATIRASGVDKHIVDGETSVQLCNYSDVYKNDQITEKITFMSATASEVEIINFKLFQEDVIITKDSEDWRDIGVPAYVPKNIDHLICGYHLALIRPLSYFINGKFLYRALLSETVADQFRIFATGVTRFGLSQGSIKNAFIPLPPIEEQKQIVSFLDVKCAQITRSISACQKEITLIEEYRTRLISDVVTGQIDVRHIDVGTTA